MLPFPFSRHAWKNRSLQMIDINLIRPNPNQPRRHFDEYELNSLTESVRRNGVLQPIAVQPCGEFYQVIAGERRLRASRMAGLREIPCVVHQTDDSTSAVIALVENIQRSDLTIFEEAEAISRAIHLLGFTQQEIAEHLGMAQSTLSNKLRLLKLTQEERDRIFAARLTERHAQALVRIESPARRKAALDKIIAEEMSVRDTEKYVAELLVPPKETAAPPRRVVIVKDIRLFVNSITNMVDNMRQSGVNATTHKNETEDYIEYIVTIPKKSSAS